MTEPNSREKVKSHSRENTAQLLHVRSEGVNELGETDLYTVDRFRMAGLNMSHKTEAKCE